MKTKTCTKCLEEKELSEFHKHSGQKSGLRPDCKECRSDEAKKLHEKFIKEFNSTRYVERVLKIDHNSIIKCCKGKQKTCGGYKWKYKENV